MATLRNRSKTPPGEKNRWRTPPERFAYANARYGPFIIDAAADATNHLLPLWYGPDSPLGPGAEDALSFAWGDVQPRDDRPKLWCNPPYDNTAAWVAHAAGEAEQGRAQTTLLIPATTDVRWFHQFVWEDIGARPRVIVEFLGRISFIRPNGEPSNAPVIGSMYVTFLARR